LDPLSGLSGEKAWIFSGTKDTVVAQSVVKSPNPMLQHYGVATMTNFIGVRHAQLDVSDRLRVR
jgi:hypothetical protein